MAKNKSEVLVAVTGEAYCYATSEPAPTSATTTLPTQNTALGYLTEDGFTVANSFDSNAIVAWQEGEEVRQVNTNPIAEITLASLQFSDSIISWWVGSEKKLDGSWEVVPSNTGGRKSYDFFVYDLPNATFTRLYVPEAEISERSDLNFVSTEAASLGVTLRGYKSTEHGFCYKIWHGPIPEEPTS